MKPLLAALFAALLTQTGGKLEIKDIQEGKGPAAKPGDILTMDYTGTLASNGKQFDSSVGKKPFQFILGAGQVIKGWDEGMVGLKEGGKRQLTIPSDMGYGKDGAGDEIPPNAKLKFDVTLLKLQRLDSKILVEGKGDKTVKGGDIVDVHYQLTDTDGKKIDSSYDRGQTLQISMTSPLKVIKGFFAALLGMKQGEKKSVTLPPDLAYGDKGAGDVIKPGQTLIFEIEMMKIFTPGAPR